MQIRGYSRVKQSCRKGTTLKQREFAAIHVIGQIQKQLTACLAQEACRGIDIHFRMLPLIRDKELSGKEKDFFHPRLGSSDFIHVGRCRASLFYSPPSCGQKSYDIDIISDSFGCAHLYFSDLTSKKNNSVSRHPSEKDSISIPSCVLV